MKKHIGIIGISLALGLPVMAQSTAVERTPAQKAQSVEKERQEDKEGHRFLDLPDLTEAQRTQLRSIFQEVRKVNQPRNEEMRTMREKLRALKAAENPDRTQINGLIDKMNALSAEIQKTRTEGELKARTILTPAQQEALKEKAKEHMKQKREHKMEHRKMQEPMEKK